MKLEKLERNKRKKIVIGVVVFLCLLFAIIYTGSRAKYKVTESIPLVNGIINYEIGDFNVVAMYQASDSGDYTEISKMPNAGYAINEEKSYCKVIGEVDDNAKLYTNANGEHVIANLQKNSKCYVYFDKELCNGVGCKTIVANSKKGTNCPVDGKISNLATTDEGICEAEDDWGISYYYRGAVDNNWVQFAGFYWRIIRINGDGSIRIIYNGPTTVQTGETTQIGIKEFNNYLEEVTGGDEGDIPDIDLDVPDVVLLGPGGEYAGIKYTIGSQHGIETNSTILGTIDSTDTTTLNGWYNNKIKGTQYEMYVETNRKFCSDRNVANRHLDFPGTTGTGTTATAFAPVDRLMMTNLSLWETTQMVTLKCANISDRLTMPIGLITSDEVIYAGGFGGSANSSYYLYTNKDYWTMSPSHVDADGYANVFAVRSYGGFGGGWSADGIFTIDDVGTAYGVRPVINLSSDVKLSGNGTTSDPYKVV